MEAHLSSNLKHRRVAHLAAPAGLLAWLVAGAVAFHWLTTPSRLVPVDRPIGQSQPEGSRVLVVVVDALRAEVAENPELMPHWAAVAQTGLRGLHQTGRYPVSAAFYKAFLAGQPASLWDVYRDLSPEPRRLVGWLHQLDHAWFAGPASGYAWVHGAASPLYVWPLRSMEAIPSEDQKVLVAAERFLERSPLPPRSALFVHFAGLDATAHRHGATGEPYRTMARRIDRFVGRLVRHFRPSDYVILVADHGVRDDGGHSDSSTDTVRWAPFAARGPHCPRGRRLRIPQDAWPFLLASWLRLALPPGYQGTPVLEAVGGDSYARALRLARAYAEAMGKPRLPLAQLRPATKATEDWQVSLQSLRTRHQLIKRLVWGLWVLTGLVIAQRFLNWHSSLSPIRPHIVVGFAWLLVATEWFWPPWGRPDGFGPLDDLPLFRASSFLGGAGALAVLGVATLLAHCVRRPPLPWLSGLATAALRNRTDLVLFATAGAVVRALFRRPQDLLMSPSATAVFVAALVCAVGQKLSYGVSHHVGWFVAVSLGLTVAVVVRLFCHCRSWPRWVLAVAVVLACVLTRLEWTGRVGWGMAAAGLVLWAVGWMPARALLASLAWLTMPPPQQWALLGLAAWLPLGRHPLQGKLWQATVAVAASLYVFHFTDGRDSYLPIDAFYRHVAGVEVDEQLFSMSLAAASVAARYLLYALVGWLIALTLCGEVAWATMPLCCGFFVFRLAVNAGAFAVYGLDAWNYHLALLFNDAAFAAAFAGIWLAEAVRRVCKAKAGCTSHVASTVPATCSC